jgi:1-acyl-sn-glycerol-3-phosphate acyltransferase
VTRDALRALVEALFRVVFTYDSSGVENVPAEGGAVISANHPSYLDPILLSLPVKRPIRFMAWDALFRVPVVGSLMRLFGAFAVDTRQGRGRAAYSSAKALVEDGHLVGIFPEGKRSRSGWMEEELRAGAARLALETGAPLVPATIRGAFRAWPYFRALPEPAKIHVRYHEPIDPAGYRSMPGDDAVAALLAELRRRVEKTLLPGVKADRRIDALYGTPAPWPRLFSEAVPALGLALLAFWKTRSFATVAPAYAYIGYLLLDLLVIPQRRLTKWVRNGSGAAFVVVYTGWILPKLGLPPAIGSAALLSVLAGAGFPHLYERGRRALAFVQGLAWAGILELGAQHLAPTAIGPHLALPLFCAAFAWEERTVFWRYSAPVLAAYALAVPLWLGGGPELLPHAVAALVAWIFVRFLPRGGAASPTTDEDPDEAPTSTLGLQ